MSEWNPNEPTTRTNHPPCECCDLGIDTETCTCGDWDDIDEPPAHQSSPCMTHGRMNCFDCNEEL